MDRTTPFDANIAVRSWVALGVGLAVAAASTFDLAPTGIAWWDPILTAGFVVSVTIGGMVGDAKRLLPPLVIVAIGSVSPVLGVLGAVGACWLATAGARPTFDVTDRTGPMLERGALSVVAAVGLLQLQSIGPVGTPTAIATASLLPLMIPLVRPPVRRWTAIAAIGLTVVAAFGVVAGLRAGTSLRAASQGLDQAAVGRGDVEVIDDAGEHLRDARASVQHWSAAPARLIPILSQHLQVVDTLATAGVAASEAGVELAELADGFGDSSATGATDAPDAPDAPNASDGETGAVDLDTLAFARDPLVEAATILERTSTELDGPARRWLIPPAAEEVDRADVTIEEFASRIDLASVLAEELPALLGRDEPQAYLILVTNPAEARRGGGIVGAFVDLTIDGGSLSVARVGRETELNWASSPPPLDGDDYPSSFLSGEPHRFVQNWTETTDPSVTARAAMELYPAMGGRSVDGVITVDPWALAAVLELAGPIRFTGPDGVGIDVDATTLPAFLLSEQYERFPDDRDRSRALAAMVGSLFGALEDADPTIDAVGDAFGPAVDEGRLTITLADTLETGEPNQLLARLGFGDPAGPSGSNEHTTDRLAIVHTNAAGNKLDAHLERTVDYWVTIDETGQLSAEARITVRNTAEPAGLPDAVAGRPERTGVARGTNAMLLSVLTPHRIESVGVLTGSDTAEESVDPLPVSITQEPTFTGGTVAVSVAPGETLTVVFALAGSIGTGDSDLDLDLDYTLAVDHQPLARDDRWTVTINGRRIADGVELRRDVTFGD